MTQVSIISASPAARRVVASAVAAGAALFAVTAQAQQRLTVDTSASAGISSNPYFGTGDQSVSGSATISVSPTLTFEDPLTSFQVAGTAQATFYTADYGTNASVQVLGAGTHKLSEQTTINGSLSYVNNIVGSFNDVRVPVGGTVIDNNLPLVVNDPALGIFGRRRQSYQAAGGISSMLSPRDRVSANAAASFERTGASGFNDYNYFSPSVAYSRALGEHFDLGAQFAVSFSDYLRTAIGDATVYSPALTMSKQISGRWTLSATAGAAIANLQEANGRRRSSTTFNGTVDLCRRDTRWNLCIDASRQTVPSAFQGVRSQTSVSTSFGYRANARDSLSLFASYSHASDPLQDSVIGIRDGSVDYGTINGNYSHLFAPSFSGFVSAGANKAFGDNNGRDANYNAQVGVSYRFGQR